MHPRSSCTSMSTPEGKIQAVWFYFCAVSPSAATQYNLAIYRCLQSARHICWQERADGLLQTDICCRTHLRYSRSPRRSREVARSPTIRTLAATCLATVC